jgi:septum formation protein
MRNFSDEWLRSYLAAEGAGLADSVGGYKIEERGIQLFSRIEGDYFAILGLPLLPLLDFLRSREAIPA